MPHVRQMRFIRDIDPTLAWKSSSVVAWRLAASIMKPHNTCFRVAEHSRMRNVHDVDSPQCTICYSHEQLVCTASSLIKPCVAHMQVSPEWVCDLSG